MRIFLAAAVLFSIIAAPVRGEEPVQIDELMPLLADLASRSGYGNGHAEVGAFLVRNSDGTVRCELWKHSAEFQTTSHRGAIPSGTIAIAHTHPRCCRDLSAHDRNEAARLGIPVIAVSMGTMHLVGGDGTVERPLRGIGWSRHRDASQICSGSPEIPESRLADALSR